MMDLQHLPNQRANEEVHLFLRRHWLEVLRIILTFVFLFGLPITLAIIFRDGLMLILDRPLVGPLVAIVISIYFLGSWLVTFVDYMDYYLDTWIVTNERIINIEQRGLFRRIASELHLADIQDVTSDVRGFVQSTLDYGNVVVQTAGATTRFQFKTISKPEKVKQMILRLASADRSNHGLNQVKKVEAKELQV